MEPLDLKGAKVWKGFLDPAAQGRLVAAIREVVKVAPLVQPVTPSGRRMSVRMTSAGRFGWVTDRSGYRYEPQHPGGMPWPAIPQQVLDIWSAVSGVEVAPESCLVNFYGPDARMGMHQDRDEADLAMPVVSVSLGDPGLFRVGNETRGGPTQSVWLESGDVVVLGGPARLLFHGIDRIKPGSGGPLSGPGRINLTLRVVSDAHRVCSTP